jgi:isopentenyl-diphosphate Delta-isomerase
VTEFLSDRKNHHLDLAKKAQVTNSSLSQAMSNLDYEPLFSAHPKSYFQKEQSFLGKKIKAPLWISSMTGGTGKADAINQNLARACREFGLGMGLGSCRPLLESDQYFSDFDLREILGDELPFFANLGICQLEELVLRGQRKKLEAMLERLRSDGLIVHLNPLQEWFQPEGDRLKRPAIDTIQDLLNWDIPLIVKEVGQGMGPRSLEALMRLPLKALEFAAFGGTNFSYLEMLRTQDQALAKDKELAFVGHSAEEMVFTVNQLLNKIGSDALCHEFIISGGIQGPVHGYSLINSCRAVCVYGQAKALLEAASGEYEVLSEHIKKQLWSLSMCEKFLHTKE